MKKLYLTISTMMLAITAVAHGQASAPPPSHVITIPIPDNIWAIIAAHAFALYWGSKLIAKFLSRWAGKSKIVDAIIWLLEHVRADSDVTPLKERDSFASPGGVGMGATDIGGKKQ